MVEMMDKLEPCPFCSEQFFFEGGMIAVHAGLYFLQCPACGAGGPLVSEKAHAVNAWNSRRAKVGAWECRKIGEEK